MARSQSAALDRKKLMADPIMVTTIVVLITFLTLFILYPLAILLVDSFVGDGSFGFGDGTSAGGVLPRDGNGGSACGFAAGSPYLQRGLTFSMLL